MNKSLTISMLILFIWTLVGIVINIVGKLFESSTFCIGPMAIGVPFIIFIVLYAVLTVIAFVEVRNLLPTTKSNLINKIITCNVVTGVSAYYLSNTKIVTILANNIHLIKMLCRARNIFFYTVLISFVHPLVDTSPYSIIITAVSILLYIIFYMLVDIITISRIINSQSTDCQYDNTIKLFSFISSPIPYSQYINEEIAKEKIKNVNRRDQV